MLYKCLLTVVLALPFGFFLSGCGGSSSDPLPTLAEVKTQDLGTVITTTGFVSVEPGILESTTAESGFALQDLSGGIYVTVDPALGLDLSELRLGRSVQITGTVGTLNGLNTLALESAEDLIASSSGGFLFFPQTLTMAELNNTDSTPERVATVVTTVADIVEDPGGSGLAVVPVEDGSSNLLGWEMNLEDGSGTGLSFMNASADHTADQWPFLTAGQQVKMTGLLFNDGSGYEIAPRGPYDISISIGDARSVADGERVLIKGTVGMVPGALSGVGEYGFSLHSENGNGILISISDPAGLYTDYDGDNQIEFSNGNNLPFDINSFHALSDPYPFAYNSSAPVALHVEGVMASTPLGDRYVVADSLKVRRVAESLAYPLSISLPTGAVSLNDVGRWANLSGSLASPSGGSSYPGGATAWRVFADGFRTTIDDGSGGNVVVLVPYGILTNSNTNPALELQDFEQFPFGVNNGDLLTVYGFLRDNNGILELVVASEGALEISPGVFNYFIF